MDNVTHALAGCLLAAAAAGSIERQQGAPATVVRRASVIIGVLTAELPDADLFYSGASLGMGKLGYLLHHRGHTHTVVFAMASAIVVWAIALGLRRELRAPPIARVLLALSIAASLSHVALDYTNSYGVHPWWPIDNRWLYGDAVFIVEPWFWIVALPPLVFIARGAFARVVFGLLLLIILGATWTVEMVGREVALMLTTGALVWSLITRAVPPARRVRIALGAWLGLEVIFFLGAASGRATVERTAGTAVRDVVLSPFPGNPFCLSALVVTVDGGAYAVTGATVAPFPALRDAAACGPSMRSIRNGDRAHRADSPAIQWGSSWSGRLDELRALAAGSCEVSAALRFMRVPSWGRMENGDVLLFDMRYGEGGFASIVARTGAPCPGPVPPWEWPRSDVLGEANR